MRCLCAKACKELAKECTPRVFLHERASKRSNAQGETNETLRYRLPKRLTALCRNSPATSSRPSLSMKSLFWGEFVAGRIERLQELR
jgi:hypothetical protein